MHKFGYEVKKVMKNLFKENPRSEDTNSRVKIQYWKSTYNDLLTRRLYN